MFVTNNNIYLQQSVKSSNNQDENSVSDQTKEQQGQQNHWLLSSLLPQGRLESTGSTDGSPIRMRESSTSPHPNSCPNPAIEIQKASPQQKPVNLLPAVPIQTSRKLSDREQRDCDVIGKNQRAPITSHASLCVLIIFISAVLQKDL